MHAQSLPILAILLVLAGCMGGSNDAAGEPRATVDAGTGGGAIEGRVTDDELVPLADAVVQIFEKANPQAPPVILTTNSSGGFAVRGLRLGEYRVFAAKDGFTDPQPKIVSVIEGVTVTVTFELRAVQVAEPYVATRSYRNTFLFEECIFTPVQNDCKAAFDPSNLTIQLKVNQTETGPLHGIVVETVWTPNIGVCSKAFQNHVFSPQQEGLDTTFPTSNSRHWADSNPFHWDNVPEDVTSPTYLRIPRDGTQPVAMNSQARSDLNGGKAIQLEGTWIVQTWVKNQGALGTPVDVGCTVEQPIEIWTSTFYYGPPPPEWSALKQ